MYIRRGRDLVVYCPRSTIVTQTRDLKKQYYNTCSRLHKKQSLERQITCPFFSTQIDCLSIGYIRSRPPHTPWFFARNHLAFPHTGSSLLFSHVHWVPFCKWLHSMVCKVRCWILFISFCYGLGRLLWGFIRVFESMIHRNRYLNVNIMSSEPSPPFQPRYQVVVCRSWREEADVMTLGGGNDYELEPTSLAKKSLIYTRSGKGCETNISFSHLKPETSVSQEKESSSHMRRFT